LGSMDPLLGWGHTSGSGLLLGLVLASQVADCTPTPRYVNRTLCRSVTCDLPDGVRRYCVVAAPVHNRAHP
jgi:hypothetical protein